MRFAFILEEKAHFPVRCLCTVLEVTRSGFYAWCARPVAAPTQDTQRLAVEVAAIHAASKQRYGSPRVHQERIGGSDLEAGRVEGGSSRV